MRELISKLVTRHQQKSAELLSNADDTKVLVRRQLSSLSDDYAGIIGCSNYDWMLCKLTVYGASEEDTLRIFQALQSQLIKFDGCTHLSSNIELDEPAIIADRLTVGLGLFIDSAVRHHKYRGAPSPEYYQGVAENCYRLTGYDSIADDLTGWLKFMQENLVL